MAMSPDDLLKWLTIGTMGSQVVSGLAGAGRSSAEREYQQAQDLYNRQQQARAANMAWLNSLMSGQTDRAAMLADRMPLGAEQGYVQRQALLGTMGQNIAGMPLPTGYGGTVNPLAGLDVNRYFGDAQTAAALAERRKALAGIEPNFQFGALSGYGLGDGAAAADRAVADYAKAMGEQRLARENAMTQFLVDQSRAAGLGAQPAGQAGQGEAPKKKGSKWATVGRIAAAAAPFVASGMKNINPQTMKLVQAASGAAQGALSGGGAGGAALGAVSGYMAPAVQPTGIGIREAILNPRAIGTIASAGLPGVYGTLGQMVSSQLRGPRTPDAPMVQSPAAAAPISESQQRYIQSRLSASSPLVDTPYETTPEELPLVQRSAPARAALGVPSYVPDSRAPQVALQQLESEELAREARINPTNTLITQRLIRDTQNQITSIEAEIRQLQSAAPKTREEQAGNATRLRNLTRDREAKKAYLAQLSASPAGRLLEPAEASPRRIERFPSVNPETFAPTPRGPATQNVVRPSSTVSANPMLRGENPLLRYLSPTTSFELPTPPPTSNFDQNALQNRVMQVESGGNPNAVSPKGAVGLMQVLPTTAADPGFEIPDIFTVARRLNIPIPPGGTPPEQAAALLRDPGVNLAFGRSYLDAMLRRYNGDRRRALIAYNAGPAVADAFAGDVSRLPAETQNYLQKVLG